MGIKKRERERDSMVNDLVLLIFYLQDLEFLFNNIQEVLDSFV